MERLKEAWKRFWAQSWWIKGSAIGGVVIVIIVIILIISAAAGGGSDDEGDDEQGTPTLELTVTVEATATPVPQPTATPLPPEPTGVPMNRLDCDEIRDTPYRSPAERTWFLSNCVTRPPPQQQQQPPEEQAPPPQGNQPPTFTPCREDPKGFTLCSVTNWSSDTQCEYDEQGRLRTVTTITVSAAYDPDGDPLIYTWSADGGSITGSGLTATLIRVAEPWGSIIVLGGVTVTVSDGRGGSDTATTLVSSDCE